MKLKIKGLKKKKNHQTQEAFSLERLNSKTQKYCNDFDCGNEYINAFVRDTNSESTDRVSYIYVDNRIKKAACVYSLACSSIILQSAANITLIPAVEIKIFALDRNFQHKSYGVYERSKDDEDLTYGDVFLSNAISSIVDFTTNICGSEYIVLYSVPEAEHFYKRNYFENFDNFMSPDQTIVNEDCIPMFYVL